MSSIHEAAYHGDLGLVQDCIVVDPNCVHSTATVPKTGPRMEMTPLRAALWGTRSSQAGAVASSQDDVVTLLIESKAKFTHSHLEDAVKSPSSAITAALLGAQHSVGVSLADLLNTARGHGHINPIKVLLAHKADPNRDGPHDNCLQVALNFYSQHLSRDIAAALIEAKADVQHCRQEIQRCPFYPSADVSSTFRISPVADLIDTLTDGYFHSNYVHSRAESNRFGTH